MQRARRHPLAHESRAIRRAGLTPAMVRGATALAFAGAIAAIVPPHRTSPHPPDSSHLDSYVLPRTTTPRPGLYDVARDGLDSSSPDAVLVLGALRRAAEVDAADALARARACRGPLRRAALVAVLEGAAAHPADALRLGRSLLHDEPALAADCGTALVGALVRAAAFDEACAFACNGPTELQAAWLTQIFLAWAAHDPETAAELAGTLAGEATGEPILGPVFDQWAAREPAQATRFALGLPSGPARRDAVHACLARWAAIDPAAMAAALPSLSDPVERDTALAAFICGTDTLTRTTATALDLASQIEDRPLRARAMAHVRREWADHDHRPFDEPASGEAPQP